jgi:Xaa-Pro aminopeptidase
LASTVNRTWDEQRLKQDRLHRVQEEMRKSGLGALWVNGGVEPFYILGTKIPSCQMFVPQDGEVIAFVRPRDEGYVRKHHSNVRAPLVETVRSSSASKDEPARKTAQGVLDLMIEHGVGSEQLGVTNLEVEQILALQDAGAHLANAMVVLENAREVKTEDEIEIYRAMGAQYQQTFQAFADAVRPGISEIELSALTEAAWREVEGEEVCQINVCTGSNMNPWRRWPTSRKLVEGEFVGLDFHGRGFAGLRGDGSETYWVGGTPTNEQRDLYKRARDYVVETAAEFRAGRNHADVLRTVPRIPDRYTTQMYNLFVGHAVGLTPSGNPALDMKEPRDDDSLQENQVLSIECFFGEVGSPLAVKLEQMIRVTAAEPEVIGKLPTQPGIV